MGNYYRMVGSQDPGSRIEQVQVEEATPEHPEKVLVLDGDPLELEPYQAERVNRYVKLELVEDYEPAEELAIVDQPGIDSPSSSTENPPNTGVAPKPDQMSYVELKEFARAENIEGRGNKNEDELRSLVVDHLAQKGV